MIALFLVRLYVIIVPSSSKICPTFLKYPSISLNPAALPESQSIRIWLDRLRDSESTARKLGVNMENNIDVLTHQDLQHQNLMSPS